MQEHFKTSASLEDINSINSNNLIDNPLKAKGRFAQNYKMRALLRHLNQAQQYSKHLLFKGHTEKIICIDPNQKLNLSFSKEKEKDQINSGNIKTFRKAPEPDVAKEISYKILSQLVIPQPSKAQRNNKLGKSQKKEFIQNVQNKLQCKFIVTQNSLEKKTLYFNTQDNQDCTELNKPTKFPILNFEKDSKFKKKIQIQQLIHRSIPNNNLSSKNASPVSLSSDQQLFGKEIKIETPKLQWQKKSSIKPIKSNNKLHLKNLNEVKDQMYLLNLQINQKPVSKNSKLYEQVYNTFTTDQNDQDKDNAQDTTYVDDFYNYVHSRNKQQHLFKKISDYYV